MTTIREKIILNHGMEENNNRKGRISNSVDVLQGPELIKACIRSGKPPPNTSLSNSEFTGSMIGVA